MYRKSDNTGRPYASLSDVRDRMESGRPCFLEFDDGFECMEVGRRYVVSGLSPEDYFVRCRHGEHYFDSNEKEGVYLGIYGPYDEEQTSQEPGEPDGSPAEQN